MNGLIRFLQDDLGFSDKQMRELIREMNGERPQDVTSFSVTNFILASISILILPFTLSLSDEIKSKLFLILIFGLMGILITKMFGEANRSQKEININYASKLLSRYYFKQKVFLGTFYQNTDKKP